MWRSLLNSARGRSAVATPFRYPSLATPSPASPAPRPTGPITPPTLSSPVPGTTRAATHPASPRPAPTSETPTPGEGPRCCCVHCGHALYVPPRALRVRCPKCSVDLPAQDVVLAGEVHEEQIVTAGRITVQEGARVSARLVACSVEVAGKVLGTVLASQGCRLRPTGKLAGSLLCRRLMIEPGATLEGSVELIRT